jgi:hypothetical protein
MAACCSLPFIPLLIREKSVPVATLDARDFRWIDAESDDFGDHAIPLLLGHAVDKHEVGGALRCPASGFGDQRRAETDLAVLCFGNEDGAVLNAELLAEFRRKNDRAPLAHFYGFHTRYL